MDKKVAIVTGASGGVGSSVVNLLSAKGIKTYGVVRKTSKTTNSLTSDNVQIRSDVTSPQSVKEIIDQVIKTEGRIDYLVNTAGFPQFGSIETVSNEQAQYAFQVEVFGPHLFIQSVLPYMRSQGSGRIVNFSSAFGKLSLPYMGFFAAGKHAIEAISDSLRLEVRGDGIIVSIINLSATDSSFFAKAKSSMDQIEESKNNLEQRNQVVAILSNAYRSALTPGYVAETVFKALTDDRPKLRYKVGTDAKLLLFLRRFSPDLVLDRIIKLLMSRSSG